MGSPMCVAHLHVKNAQKSKRERAFAIRSGVNGMCLEGDFLGSKDELGGEVRVKKKIH